MVKFASGIYSNFRARRASHPPLEDSLHENPQRISQSSKPGMFILIISN